MSKAQTVSSRRQSLLQMWRNGVLVGNRHSIVGKPVLFQVVKAWSVHRVAPV